MSQHPSHVPPDLLLARAASELRTCSEIVARIEDAILPLIATPIDQTLRAALQDVDLLNQCIEDVARGLAGLSAALVGQPDVNAEVILSQIRLQDMRLRLQGGSFDSRKLPQKEEIFGAFQDRVAVTAAGNVSWVKT